jgi:transcriptional regulator with XRE-family HTH domain
MIEKSIIKQIRQNIGMLQVDFACALGVSQAYVSVLEAGARDITFDMAYRIKRLAKIYGIKLNVEEIRPDCIAKK